MYRNAWGQPVPEIAGELEAAAGPPAPADEREAPPPRALFIVRSTPAHMSVRQNIRFSRLPLLIFKGL